MKAIVRLFVLLFALQAVSGAASGLAAQVRPTVVQGIVGSGSTASITLALPAAPVTGHMLFAVLGYGIYGERAMAGPDASWTCTQGAGGSVRLSICSHIVVAGDPSSYTFTATSADGPGIGGYLMETANTVGSQMAFSYSTGVSLAPSPALVPSVAGMLPIGITIGGRTATTSSGWSTLVSLSGFNMFAGNSLTADLLTAISTSFIYADSGSTLQGLMLLAPGVFASAPTVSPAAGSYASAQTVTLADTTAGAAIHYTLDGSTPTCSSASYSSGLLLTTSTTLRSVACATGYASSAVTTSNFVIAAGTLQGISLGALGDLHGYVPFAGDAFHTAINNSPVDANSANIIAGIGAGHLHHDWSSVNGGNYGIPYTVVDSSVTPLVPFLNQLYSDESDPSVYPIPVGLPIESLPPNCTITGDNHAIMFDKATGVDYEFYQAQYCPGKTPIWQASNGVMWDTTINEKRPYSYTSVDAAGLSVFEGLVRYDEIVAGKINHALRFTTSFTRCDHYVNGDGMGAFVAPATHAACTNSGTLNITGMRIRLKSSFDISGYSATNQIILQALKTYGMILADNGSSLYFQGTPDPRWNDNDLQALDQVLASNLEVVQMPTVYTNDNHPTGAVPVIANFKPSQSTITLGQSVTLNASLTGASYSFVDLAGFMRNGSVTTTPAAVGTYTYKLTTRNQFGESTATTTVTVTQPTQISPNLQLMTVPDKAINAAPFTVSATSLSPAPITYSVTSGPATISGNVVRVTGQGLVVLYARQAATGNYTAAVSAATFNVGPQAPTLSFNPVANVSYGALPFLVLATSDSPAAITYSVLSGPAKVVGNIVTVTGAGTVTLQATQKAAGNYSAATASVSFMVNPIAPTLSMNPIADKTVGAAPFVVSSTSNSSGGTTYSIVSGAATIAGNVVTVTGPGLVTVNVAQVAAGNYTAATASTNFMVGGSVNSAPQITQLSVTPIPTQTLGTAPFALGVTTNSNAPVTYGLISGPAIISGNTITLTGTGLVQFVAVQAANSKYTSAMAVGSFTVVAKTTINQSKQITISQLIR